RRWIALLVREYGPYRCLFLSPAELAEQDGPYWHPCLVGLYGDDGEMMISFMKKRFPETCEKHATFRDVLEALRIKSLEIHFELSVANLVRAGLGDIVRDGRDWYRPFLNAAAARSEIAFRHDLMLDCPCDPTRVANEHELIEANLLSGVRDPLVGVI